MIISKWIIDENNDFSRSMLVLPKGAYYVQFKTAIFFQPQLRHVNQATSTRRAKLTYHLSPPHRSNTIQVQSTVERDIYIYM